MKMDLDLDELLEGMTRDGMRKFVKKLLSASEKEERKLLENLTDTAEKELNDLADLREEKRGKPNKVDMDASPSRSKK